MDCKKYIPLISAYADGALDERERIVVASHLHACARCAAELEGIRRIKTMASSLGQAAPAPFFETRVMGRIAARRAENARPSVFVSIARTVFAAGLGMLLVTAGIRGFYPAASPGSMEQLLVQHGAELNEDMLLAKAEISENDIIALSSGREVGAYD